MNRTVALVGSAIFLALFVLVNSAFVVPEADSAIVLRFGAPKKVYTSAGLKFKMPFVENVLKIDRRNREINLDDVQVIVANQERLLVDAFARYTITDPLLFYQSVANEKNGNERLKTLMEQTVRRVLGEVSVDDIVSGKRSELMHRIRDLLSGDARALGVEIIDVKIRRADLPPQNSEAVFKRMITERNQLAQQIRAEGAEQAQKITAQAERERTEILATANEQSEKMRGEADATRSAVFAAAYGRDPEFFDFYRSLLAYEQSFKSGDGTVVLSPDSEFLRYLNDLKGRR